MPKKPSRKTLSNKLDKAWSEVVKHRAGYKCEVSGVETNLNAHHYISRNNRMLRWDPRNGVCVTAKHHVFSNESFHLNPEWAHFWMEEHRWEDLQYLVCHMNEIKKWTLDEMQEQLDNLNSLLK